VSACAAFEQMIGETVWRLVNELEGVGHDPQGFIEFWRRHEVAA
jgi:hypothetical protein